MEQISFAKKTQYFLEYIPVFFLAGLAQILPLHLSQCLASFFGDLSFYVLKKKRNIALNNLKQAFPEKNPAEITSLAKASFRHISLTFAELFLIPKFKKNVEKHIYVREPDKLTALKGRPVLLVVAHVGSWELMEWIGHYAKYDLLFIVRSIKNIFIDTAVNKLRASIPGSFPVHKSQSATKAMRHLRKKGMVAIVVDQWAGPEGIWVDFFGRKTSTTSIAARLALKTNAVILPAFCIRKNVGQYEYQISDPLEVEGEGVEEEVEITKKLNLILENKIREYPEQWIWGHHRWKPKPENIRAGG